MKGKKPVKQLLIICLIAIAIYAVFSYLSGSIANQDKEMISTFISSFGTLAVFVFIIIVIVEVVIAPIPSLVMYAIGGAVFGTFIGGTVALAGNIIGAAIDFKIAQKYGRKFVEERVEKKKMEQFDRFFKRHGGMAIFFLRLNPFTSSDLFSYLAGLSKINMRQLLVGTGLGLLPLTYLQSYLGESVLSASSLWMWIFLSLSILYIFVFYYYLFKKK